MWASACRKIDIFFWLAYKLFSDWLNIQLFNLIATLGHGIRFSMAIATLGHDVFSFHFKSNLVSFSISFQFHFTFVFISISFYFQFHFTFVFNSISFYFQFHFTFVFISISSHFRFHLTFVFISISFYFRFHFNFKTFSHNLVRILLLQLSATIVISDNFNFANITVKIVTFKVITFFSKTLKNWYFFQQVTWLFKKNFTKIFLAWVQSCAKFKKYQSFCV